MNRIAFLSAFALVGCGAPPAAGPEVPPSPAAAPTSSAAMVIEEAHPLDSAVSKGTGPHADLDALCGKGGERCTSSKAFAVHGGGGVIGVATYTQGASHNGDTKIALQTATGWFTQDAPDGAPDHPVGHHSPLSVELATERTVPTAEGVKVFRVSGGASFLPGRGSAGSSRHQSIEEMSCRVEANKVTCGEAKPLFSEECRNPEQSAGPANCTTTGKKPW